MSVDPFAHLRMHAGGTHAQKAKLCIVLSAIEDVIRERRQGTTTRTDGPPSMTEYFAALMTALESASASHQHEITHLLALVLPFVSEAVLRAKYSAVAKLLHQVLQDAEREANSAQLRAATTCLGLALQAQEPSPAAWARPELLRAFQLLLTLATDARPKVRKNAQKCVGDLLELHSEHQCDALSTHIASFAENVFAQSTSKDEARLVVLVAFLKLALPYLPKKVVASLVDALAKYVDSSVKNLRLVTHEAFDALASSPTSRLSQETLAKLLAAVLNAKQSTVRDADLAIHAVSILETALVRLSSSYSEAKARELLPRVVGLVCSHLESASRGATKQAAQSLLVILTQCLSPQVLRDEADATDIARVLSSLQSLMTLRYQAAWKHIFPMLASLFDYYGVISAPALNPLLLTACELHEASSQLASSSPQQLALFAQVASSAVGAVGPERFLEVVPLTHPTDIINDKRQWLLPVFQDALRGYPCSLAFFHSSLLELARQCEVKSRADNVTPLHAKKLQNLTLQLWRLFPTFCTSCVDIDTSFKKVAKLLANAMADARYPELRLIVCQGLQALVKRTRVVTSAVEHGDDKEEEDEEDDDDDGDEDFEDEEEVDEEKLARDREALAKYAGRYLPLLISFVEEIDPDKDTDKIHVLLDTVQGFASLAEPTLVAQTFRKIMQTLLESSTDAKKLANGEPPATPKHIGLAPAVLQRVAHSQLALATALVRHMDAETVQLLYRVIKPYLLDDTDGAMQKRAYAVLVAICDHHAAFMHSESNLSDMTASICESLLTCSIPAKKMRLRCLVHLIKAMELHVDALPAESELIPNLVGEIMLCTKEANGKAREAAFELLVAMAQLVKAQHPQNGLQEFVQMLLGGLAARTPHMRSAAVVCLSRVVFEFGREDDSVAAMMPPLLKTVLMLLHEKAREVIKSVVGFMKLGIAILTKDQLEPFLPDIINGLLIWIGESKHRFRAKTRIVLMKLCRKYGYDKVASLVPVEDRALIKHIKKTKEREDKKKEAERAERHSRKKSGHASTTTNADSFEQFMADSEDEDDEEDAEDENAAFKAALRRKRDLVTKKSARKSAQRIHEVGDDDIVDFLDANAAVTNVRVAKRGGDDSDDDMDELPVAKDGRFIIQDDAMGDGSDESEDEEAIKNDVAAQLERMGLSKGSGKADKGAGRKRGRDDEGEGGAGKEFRAKKAGGDVKKKGKFEPYAYIPLDPKLMAKRNKRNAVNKYKSNVGKRKNLRG